MLYYFRSKGTSGQEVTAKEVTEVEESLKKIRETLPQPNKCVAIVYCDDDQSLNFKPQFIFEVNCWQYQCHYS